MLKAGFSFFVLDETSWNCFLVSRSRKSYKNGEDIWVEARKSFLFYQANWRWPDDDVIRARAHAFSFLSLSLSLSPSISINLSSTSLLLSWDHPMLRFSIRLGFLETNSSSVFCPLLSTASRFLFLLSVAFYPLKAFLNWVERPLVLGRCLNNILQEKRK